MMALANALAQRESIVVELSLRHMSGGIGWYSEEYQDLNK
jgi:hypothetical protein